MKTLLLTVFAALCLCMGSGLMAQCGGCGGCGSGTAVKSDATAKKAACADAVKSAETKEVGTVCDKCAKTDSTVKAEKTADVKAAEAKAAAAKAAQKAAAKANVKADTNKTAGGCGGCGSDCSGCGEGCGTSCKTSACGSKKAASAEAVKKAAAAEAIKTEKKEGCDGCGQAKKVQN